ncbi:MAG: DUF4147 domain-containing protein [Clostridiales Family XIII bacterium]|nr:DUF4147 domain-containing protein [Clostridiales Family XIII bacterium]
MNGRIQNADRLTSHGNRKGREDLIEILEAGLGAADPYNNVRSMLELKGDILKVGNPLFEADGDPQSGVESIDLRNYDRIFAVGAGKGVQRVAKAIEDVLGDKLTGGAVISKHGDLPVLTKITNTYGGHPTPDRGCVDGAKKIMDLSRDITERDLVFTIIMNGGSSLLTLPFEGITVEDVKQLTYLVQIKYGIHTTYLNYIRNHIDQLKGGRIARAFSPAKMIHLFGTDANRHDTSPIKQDYNYIMRHNVWLHNLPDGSTFADAQKVLETNALLDECPRSIRDAIYEADAEKETVKYDEYIRTDFRFFGIMPENAWLTSAYEKAQSLGYRPFILTRLLNADPQQAANVIMAIASNIADRNEPFASPAALITGGEMLVPVNAATGIGGTNQEFCLTAATRIAGSDRIVCASVDTDGTDGPGGFRRGGVPECLGGGIVDGSSARRAEAKGIDIPFHLKNHDTTLPLWEMGDGIVMKQNISVCDLSVTLITEQ